MTFSAFFDEYSIGKEMLLEKHFNNTYIVCFILKYIPIGITIFYCQPVVIILKPEGSKRIKRKGLNSH